MNAKSIYCALAQKSNTHAAQCVFKIANKKKKKIEKGTLKSIKNTIVRSVIVITTEQRLRRQ